MKQFEICRVLLALILMGLAPFSLEFARANDGEDDLTALFNEVPLDAITKSKQESQQAIESLEPDSDHLIVDKKKTKFAGWGPYYRDVKALCAGLAKDGRAIELKTIVENQIGINKHCLACDPLFKMIVKNCQPKIKKESVAMKKKRIAEEQAFAELSAEDRPTPIPIILILQREPNTALQIILQDFNERLDKNPKRMAEGRMAITLLANLLGSLSAAQEPAGKRDYFSDLSILLGNNLQAKREETNKGNGKVSDSNLHVGRSLSEDVDQLFN